MTTTTSDPLIGRVIDGRYEITSRVARGGMATVYKAHDRRLDRVVALKVMHPHLADTPQVTARFRREARAAARLTHPGVVGVYDQGWSGDLQYLTMEYIDGANLRALLRRRGALPVGQALSITMDVLSALAAAHRAGLVHRDIKPENILLTTDGAVKVADFGLARAVSEATVATSGSLLGTVAYLSPEIVTNGQADARADVYAVGTMLFEMLTGRQPFQGATPIQVAYQHVHSRVPSPSDDVLWLPYAVDELVATLTDPDPAKRPVDGGTARDLVQNVYQDLDPHNRARRAEASGTSDQIDTAEAGADSLEQEWPSDAGDRHATTSLEHTGTIALPIGGFASASTTTDDGGRRHRRRTRLGLVIVAVLVVLAIAAGTWWFFSWGPGAYTPVPSVAGTSEADAVATLSERGLDAKTHEEFSDSVAEGLVIDSDPAAGADIKNHGTVELTISKGVEMVKVPKVVDQKEEDAISALKQAGFTVSDSPKQVYSAKVDAGHVVSSDPDAGESVPHDAEITLTVSRGREPISIPDVTGENEKDALAELKEAGAKPKVEHSVYNSEIEKGKVISQSAQGDGLRGDAVSLTVSKGPEMIEVPNVFGKQFDEAKKQLTDLGFDVARKDFLGGLFGTVRSQDPEAGELAEKGSTITLRVV